MTSVPCLSFWPLSTCDRDVIIVRQLPCFLRLLCVLCFNRLSDKNNSFTYEINPVQMFIYIYKFWVLFSFCKQNIKILSSVYWPIKTCFRHYLLCCTVYIMHKMMIKQKKDISYVRQDFKRWCKVRLTFSRSNETLF